MSENTPPPSKPGLHPRNRARHGYDFTTLVQHLPSLAKFLRSTPDGAPSIDFSQPAAVLALNRALLHRDYGIVRWSPPGGHLCPAVPGRADYIHTLADLLAEPTPDAPPTGTRIRLLDIGTGATAIYPLIAHAEYGWRSVGVDIDPAGLAHAAEMLRHNPAFAAAIELREQPVATDIFKGILRHGEYFDATLCNPPFHDAPESAAAASRRKWNNLGKGTAKGLNFGGQDNELWCPGGERGFVTTLIEQSAGIGQRCLWFTTLVSKADNLPIFERLLKRAAPREVRTLDMAQGQKRSRVLAWSFMDAAGRKRWCKQHRQPPRKPDSPL